MRDKLLGYFLIVFLTLCILAIAKSIIWGQEARSAKVRTAYLESIGLTRTPKGCQVDHVIALACGGPDIIENLQLICGPSLKAKEKHEQNCDEFFKTWGPMCLDLK